MIKGGPPGGGDIARSNVDRGEKKVSFLKRFFWEFQRKLFISKLIKTIFRT